jgi:hypothetical protein
VFTIFKKIKDKFFFPIPAAKVRGFPPGWKNNSGHIVYIIIIALLILVILLMVLAYKPNLIEMPGKLVNTLLAFAPNHQISSLAGDLSGPADGNSATEVVVTPPADTAIPPADTAMPTDAIIPPTDATATTDMATPSAAAATPTINISSADTTIPPAVNAAVPAPTPPLHPNIQENIPAVRSSPVVTKVTSPILFGNFKTGVIPIMVFFNRAITVSGKPQLIISTGSPATTAVDYKYSFNNFLFFSYRISPGNYSPDLDYSSSSALVLNGGEIKDISGNAANPALPEPGSPSSLSGSSNIVIGSPK